MVLLRQTQFTGGAPNISVAYTINGQPGDLYRCSSQGLELFNFHTDLPYLMIENHIEMAKKI